MPLLHNAAAGILFLMLISRSRVGVNRVGRHGVVLLVRGVRDRRNRVLRVSAAAAATFGAATLLAAEAHAAPATVGAAVPVAVLLLLAPAVPVGRAVAVSTLR